MARGTSYPGSRHGPGRTTAMNGSHRPTPETSFQIPQISISYDPFAREGKLFGFPFGPSRNWPGIRASGGFDPAIRGRTLSWDVSKESLGIDGICSMGAGLVVLDAGESRVIEGASCWLFFRSLA